MHKQISQELRVVPTISKQEILAISGIDNNKRFASVGNCPSHVFKIGD